EKAQEAEAEQRRESDRRGAALVISSRRISLAGYASGLQLAQREWELGNIARVRKLLRETERATETGDLRGFEWHYLRRQCDAAALTLSLPPGLIDPRTRVERVDISADGTRLLAVTRGRLLAWDIPGVRAVSLLKNTTRSILDARFSPDGRSLAVLAINLPPEQYPTLGLPDSQATFLEIWDLASGERLQSIELPQAIEGRVAIRPN